MKYRAKQIKLLTCGRTCSALGRRADTQDYEEAVALCKQIDEGGGVDGGHDGGGTGTGPGMTWTKAMN